MPLNSLVSIIIVAFNNWPDLELAIQSALNQSYEPVEVIVVDNSSTDETQQLVPQLFANRLKYIRQPNTGEGGGRNTGVEESQGEFVQFLDGDDLLAPNKVEKQIAMLNEFPEVDVVYGDVRQFQTNAGAANWSDCDTEDYPDMLATLLSPKGNGAGLVVHSVIFRRRALELIGTWTENLPASDGPVLTIMSDQDYWLRAAWSGCRFQYCQNSLCFQRRRSGQLSSNSRAVLRGMESVLTSASAYITKEPYRTCLSRRLSHLLFYLAISDKESTRGASFARLKKARGLNMQLLTMRAYLLGWMLIVSGVGPFVFGRWLKPMRRMAALLCGARRLV